MKPLQLLFSLAVFFCMAGAKAYAHDIAVKNQDGVTIYYDFVNDGTELEVTHRYRNFNSYYFNVVIPESVTFNGKTYSVTSIGDDAFMDCGDLTSVTIPGSVKTIGDLAFYNCSNLTSIIIPDGVTTIKDCAFSGCTRLTSITLPNSLTSVGVWIFAYCSSIAKPIYNERLFVHLPTSFEGSYTIPSGITTICNSAFMRCANLRQVTIPSSVTKIEDSAFCECTSLASVDVPSSVTSIGGSAFASCHSLSSFTLLNSVTYVGHAAFSWCGVKTPIYNDRLFAYLPETFEGSYTIPSGITTICGCAFADCHSLSSVVIPGSVTSIGNSAFAYCSSLGSISISNSVATIESLTFEGCSSLASIDLPNSITTIKERAFQGCSNLASVTLPSRLKTIDCFAFQGCGSLSTVSIPDSVELIGYEAFDECDGLESLVLGSGVKQLGLCAFGWCTALKEITVRATEPPFCAFAPFAELDMQTCRLNVPEGCKSAYQQADWWKDFFSIDEDVAGISGVVNGGDVQVKERYTLDGKRRGQAGRGLNILRMSDGSIRKVVVR